ncbi:MAG: mannose-6-phosphate isomerase, class I [Sphingobacteriales bacterium]|nr:mannose-6-phosphate isomerase, class I [Sphingobacteriales bacterium]
MPGIYRLKGTVKHYDWGGASFIPSLLRMENKNNQPFAEYWMGTHPQDNCTIELAGHHPEVLKDYLKKYPEFLGKEVQDRFGHLPYLFKVLDVHKMLSIQVHPSKAAAEKEFARENAEGIPIDSVRRNYKDDNHKPELMVALSNFWLLHGFKPPEEMTYTLLNVTELRELLPVFNQSGYEGLYRHVMEMPQEDVNRILQPLINNLATVYRDKQPDKYDEDFWAAKAAYSFPHNGKIDRGIFSIYLFNLVHLKKGEGIFQNAGVPHAYLEGQNVEIMASSDNVLRGGLTNKHIDVKELLKHVKCEPTHVQILKGEPLNNFEKVYSTAAPDFQLSMFELHAGDGVTFSPVTTEIILLTEGMAELSNGNGSLKLEPGHASAIVFPGRDVKLSSPGGAVVFRASVPSKASGR